MINNPAPEIIPKWLSEKAADAELRLQLFLPFCVPTQRQLPNEIVRSALFTCRNRNTPRQHYKNKEIAVIGDGTINYQGEELRQDDERVWMHLLYLARDVRLGEPIVFLPRKFLQDIHWPTNGEGYNRLRVVMDRMAATGLKVFSSRLDSGGVNVSLIRKIEYYIQSDSGQQVPLKMWRVWIEPEMRLLFDPNFLTCVNWELYHNLKNGVAKKLFLYWSSHKKPFPVRTETLMELCSTLSPRKEFRRTLSEALDELQAASFLTVWKVAGNLWSVKRQFNVKGGS